MQAIALRILLMVIAAAGAGARTANLERDMVLMSHVGGEDPEIARWQRGAEASAGGRAAKFEGLAWAYVAKARRPRGCWHG